MLRTTAILFLTLAVSAGCQRAVDKPANLPELFPLTVTVLQEGTPVPGAFVRLIPEDPAMPWSCGATTDDGGEAVINTIGQYPGAPAGRYKVLISKLETPPTTGTDLSSLSVSKKPAAPAPAAPAGSESVNRIDPKFALPNATPLAIQVAEGQSKASFDVGAPVREAIKAPR